MMRCSACTRNLKTQAKFCGGCGTDLLFEKKVDAADISLMKIAAVTAMILVLGVLGLFVFLVVALVALKTSVEFIALTGAVFLVSSAVFIIIAVYGLTELFRTMHTPPRPALNPSHAAHQQNPPREPRFSVTEDTTLIMKQPAFFIRPQ